MKAYYTFISKKQIGVIFANWKRGTLTLSEEVINWLYRRCSEIRGFIDNTAYEGVLSEVKEAIDAIFAGDLAVAHANIEDAYARYHIIYEEC